MVKLVSTKGQLWSIDFMVGSVLFVLMVIAFFNQISTDQAPPIIRADLLREGIDVSGLFLTTGQPSDWNGSSLQLLGVTDGEYRISYSKWNSAATMNYSAVRSALRLQYNVFIFAEDNDGCQVMDLTPIGDGGTITQTCPVEVDITASNLVPVRRIGIYNGSATKIIIYSWN